MRGETVYRSAFTGPGSDDAHGNSADSWGSDAAIHGCMFAPGSDQEPFEAGRNAVVSTPTLYAPAGTVAGPRDRITVRGKAYEVVGYPGDWRWPVDNRGAGVVIALRRVEG